MATRISTQRAPAAIGPYAQAVEHGGLVFLSGQIPLEPASGRMVDTDDVTVQTEQVMENLGAVLEAAGCSFRDVLKATLFLTDMADYVAVNAVYARYFDEECAPARAAVQVAGLPRGAKIEIELIAARPTG